MASSKRRRILVGIGDPPRWATAMRSLVVSSTSPPSGPTTAAAVEAAAPDARRRRERLTPEPLDHALGDLVGVALYASSAAPTSSRRERRRGVALAAARAAVADRSCTTGRMS
jgi:hypothetical protein